MELRDSSEINQLLDRIDALMRELEGIRRQILHLSPPDTQPSRDRPSMAEQMFGGMGKGSWQEYDSFDDYLRFSL